MDPRIAVELPDIAEQALFQRVDHLPQLDGVELNGVLSQQLD